MSKEIAVSQKQIENRIFFFRDKQIMPDYDLAELYQVEIRVLNQAVKRNIDRFPEAFLFQLSREEFEELVTNNERLGFLRSQICDLKRWQR